METQKSRIPFCRSEFLQDVSIELGRRLKALRYCEGNLEFSVRERDDDSSDQFSAISWGRSRGYVQVVVTESKRGNYVRRYEREIKGTKAEYLAYIVDLTDLDATEIALLIRDSLYGNPEALDFWERRHVPPV